jgi:hypothetical protein
MIKLIGSNVPESDLDEGSDLDAGSDLNPRSDLDPSDLAD